MEENADYYGVMIQAEEESLAAKEGVSAEASEGEGAPAAKAEGEGDQHPGNKD